MIYANENDAVLLDSEIKIMTWMKVNKLIKITCLSILKIKAVQ
jgi:hypothetical protein